MNKKTLLKYLILAASNFIQAEASETFFTDTIKYLNEENDKNVYHKKQTSVDIFEKATKQLLQSTLNIKKKDSEIVKDIINNISTFFKQEEDDISNMKNRLKRRFKMKGILPQNSFLNNLKGTFFLIAKSIKPGKVLNRKDKLELNRYVNSMYKDMYKEEIKNSSFTKTFMKEFNKPDSHMLYYQMMKKHIENMFVQANIQETLYPYHLIKPYTET